MTRILTSLSFIFLVIIGNGQEVNIIPKPAKVLLGKQHFTLTPETKIFAEETAAQRSAQFLNNYLKNIYGFSLKFTRNFRLPGIISISSNNIDHSKTDLEGAYYLDVRDGKITISSEDSIGQFYAVQSLIQLLPLEKSKKLTIPDILIEDRPRFKYRGMHLDCARHFWPVSFIKKYIDYLALHKMNYFHWHLTEDQGWRMEVRKYPNLTKIGGWRNGTIIARYPGKGNDETRYGGYYTQQEIKDIVRYAADRFITVIPEIEMPGHGSAAIAAYPFLSCFPNEPTRIPENMISKKSIEEQSKGRIKLVQETWGIFDDVFCAGKDSTFDFLENVLDEVLALFPSKYIHVGGDECPKNHWKRCPNCQQRMKNEKLKDEHELQSYFIQRIEKYLNSRGRILIGWDEILEGGLAPNAVVMSWRGEQGGIEAAKEDHDVIMTPGGWCYFDHSQSQNEDSIVFGGYTPVEKVYSYEPIPAKLNEKQGKHVLGAQGNVWTEYMKNTRKVEYQIFPRMSALSEVVWTGKEDRNWEDFEKRLMTQFKRYELWGANYSKAYFSLRATVLPAPDHDGILWKLESRYPESRIMYMNEISPSLQYDQPVRIKKTHTYSADLYSTRNEKINSISQKFHFNKATGKKITLKDPPSQNYPGDGAFTLVNGVINEKGLTRGREFLGFLGADCEAVIDLGKEEIIQKVKVHVLTQVPSWIWRPKYVEISAADNGKDFKVIGMTDDLSNNAGKGFLEMKLEKPVTTRFIKVFLKNWGEIPEGNPGANSMAWLFVDEIEIE